MTGLPRLCLAMTSGMKGARIGGVGCFGFETLFPPVRE